MSKEWSISDEQKGARTIEDIVDCHKKPKSQSFGCANPPLFQSVPIDHVVPDILHLYLRITDVLFNLLIVDLQRYDAVAKSSNPAWKSRYLDQLQFFINDSCKINFHFFVSQGSKEIHWRDLMGPEKCVFFRKILLTEQFPDLPNVRTIQGLWSDFITLESRLHSESVSPVEAKDIGQDAKDWVVKFTTIYQSKFVTPYLHIFAMHITEFLLKYKSLVIFTLQGMEKLNDATTIDFAKSTNHNYRSLEALKQIMSKRNRVEHLLDTGYERAPKVIKCSRCDSLGHNSHTCDAEITHN